MAFGNAGILDYHIMLALQQGWKAYYKSDAAQFAKLFQGVSSAVLTKWHAGLTARDLQVRLDNARGEMTLPCVVVRLESEAMTMIPFGTSMTIGGELCHPFLLNQRATVEIRTPTPELTRALAVVVRAVLHLARGQFCKNIGYNHFSFEGGGALSPEEQYIAEQSGLAGITLYRMAYTAESEGSIPDPVGLPEAIDWFVLAEDESTVDGLPGGVVPLPQP